MSMSRMIIGIAGRKRSGKGTAASFFCKHFGFIEMNYADPLKEGIAKLFGWTLESMYDDALKEEIDPFYGFSRRKAMQVIGTEAVRDHLGEDVWVKRMEHRLLTLEDSCPRVVISDIRMRNELELVEKLGGVIIHIYADLRLGVNMDNHRSEKPLTLKPDHKVIYNDCGLDLFEYQLQRMSIGLGLMTGLETA